MTATVEPLTTTGAAAKSLGIGRTQMSAIRRAMGITMKYFFLSDVVKWIKRHPDFKQSDVYLRRTPRRVTPKRPGTPPNPPYAQSLTNRHDHHPN